MYVSLQDQKLIDNNYDVDMIKKSLHYTKFMFHLYLSD